jgi:O-antigen/teichoic acid export membrane protein
MRVRGERLRWLLPTIAIFLLFTFGFTRQILALFRPEFVEEGLLPLRLLALSTAFSVVFALAPTYLKYARRTHVTYLTVAITALLQVLMLIVLVPRFGATGAAAANATSMVAMYGAFAWMATREVRRLEAGG